MSILSRITLRLFGVMISGLVFVFFTLFIYYNQAFFFEQGLLHSFIWLFILYIASTIATFILVCIFVRGIQGTESDTGGRRQS